jgi:anti-anti-sigma regulatory factor
MRAEVVELSRCSRLVTFGGEVDAVGARVMAEVFAQLTRPEHAVAVDLMAVDMLSAAGAAALYELGNRTEAAGGKLVVAAPPGSVATSLAVCRRDAATSVVDSRAAALAEIGASGTDLPAPEVIDIRGMRNRVFISQALAVLRCRYGLASTDSAFALMCTVSQRHNVSVRTLAGAVLDLRPPAGDRWFPGRTTPRAPRLSFCPRAPTPSATFTAALDAMAWPLGDIHSVDPFHGGLVLEHHCGPADELFGDLAVLDDGTAGVLAQKTGRAVVVDDVPTDPRLAPTARAALLRAGVAAVRGIPLLARNRDCLGVVSLYDGEPHPPPLPRRVTWLVAETARWLDWYRRTIVFDALEQLHQQAQPSSGRTRRRSRR